MAARRPRRLTLERSVEEAMRRRLSTDTGNAQLPPGADLFPGELDEAIDQALLALQQRRRMPGNA